MTSFSSRASHRIAFFFALHRGQASFHRDLLSSIVQAKKCLQNIVFAMKFFGSSSLLLCVLALASTVFTSSFNLSPRIMNLATKRIAAAAIVTFGLTGMPDQIFSFSTAAVASAAAAETKSIFDGMYSDPNHPGCMRKITNKGKIVTLEGSDNLDGSKPFIIMAKEDFPGTIFVDFSPKGGPPNLLGVFDETANAIKWPDGNSWKKLN